MASVPVGVGRLRQEWQYVSKYFLWVSVLHICKNSDGRKGIYHYEVYILFKKKYVLIDVREKRRGRGVREGKGADTTQQSAARGSMFPDPPGNLSRNTFGS